MDWHGTSDEASKTVEIAVIKVEATVPVTDPTYGGAVVLNPGEFELNLTHKAETYEAPQAGQVAPVLDKCCEEVMLYEHSSPPVQMLTTKPHE
jgi:hypothetical protein